MEILSIILNFVLGSGIVGIVIFYSSHRRKAAAEASSAEFVAQEQDFAIQKVNIEFLSSQLQEAWSEVEKMQEIINSKRGKVLSLMAHVNRLEIDFLEYSSARHRAEIISCTLYECEKRTAA